MFYVFGMFLPPSGFVQCWYCVYISKILDYCLFSFFFFFFMHLLLLLVHCRTTVPCWWGEAAPSRTGMPNAMLHGFWCISAGRPGSAPALGDAQQSISVPAAPKGKAPLAHLGN